MIYRTSPEVLAYIRATTSYGGEQYPEYAGGYTEANMSAFEKWLIRQHKAEGVTLYRGYTFDERYWEDCFIEEGCVIGVDQLTAESDIPAFTTSQIRAARYINDYGNGTGRDDVRVLFKIQTNGRSFVDISPFSIYPEENEYRCTRKVRLRVDSINRKGGYLNVSCTEV